jgi:hypothetical protein
MPASRFLKYTGTEKLAKSSLQFLLVSFYFPGCYCTLFGISNFPAGESRFFLDFAITFLFCFRHYAEDLFWEVPQKCTILDLSPLYILVFETYSKLERKTDFLAPGVYFVQPCLSAGQRFAASRSRLQYY